ncbi:MAG: hypothetical protein RR280_04250 [Bacteroidaceae bacterium]
MSEDLTPFQRHYEKNKDAISEERKTRYATDPEYRMGVLKQRKEYLQSKREEEGKTPLEEVPADYKYTIADVIGNPPMIGRNTISGWVAKGNLPAPKKINGIYYFNETQARALRTFIKAIEGRKRVFTSGDFTEQVRAVHAAFEDLNSVQSIAKN